MHKYINFLVILVTAAINIYVLYKAFKRALEPSYEIVYPTAATEEIAFGALITMMRAPKLRKKPKPRIYLFQAFVVVIGLLVADLGVVWGLVKIAGPIPLLERTEINTHNKAFDVVIHATGPVGVFLAIAVIGLFAIFRLSRDK